MKRKSLVLSLLALAVVALTAADASAWGWWRYRSACCGHRFHLFGGHGNHCCGYQPYNAFSPRPSCCQANCDCTPRGHHFGHRHGGHAPACAPIGGCCLAAPVMQDLQTAQYIDPSLLPYMAQSAPMQMPMEMPIQPMAYQAPYGIQPASYMPAYYQPYPTYYYPQQPAYPYYGYNFGY